MQRLVTTKPPISVAGTPTAPSECSTAERLGLDVSKHLSDVDHELVHPSNYV